MSPAAAGAKLLVGACGCANVVNLPAYLMALNDAFDGRVTLLMTRSAEVILSADTAGLFCARVIRDADSGAHFQPGHMRLALEADVFVVLPASAHVLGATATGLADNLLSSAILGSPRPVVFFPSMNRHMWANASVQRNVATIRGDGHLVIDPVITSGYELATGTRTANPGLPPAAEVARMVAELSLPLDEPGWVEAASGSGGR